jgi:YVTN family beta-propeller protein
MPFKGVEFQEVFVPGGYMHGRSKNSRRTLIWCAAFCAFLLGANFTAAQAPSPALLVLEKSDNMLAIVDPASLQVVARVPAGPDPHEIVASADARLAYISNYGGNDSTLNTISVVDLTARKALQPINLGALRSTHGLAFAGGKLYFTAETNKVIGRYDPATQSVDWVLGTGQDRTHMVAVSEDFNRIVTSNVSSGTISIIELVSAPMSGFGPPPGSPPGNTFVARLAPATADTPPGGPPPGMASTAASPRKTWRVTNVAAGRGAEGFDVSPDGREIWAANAQDATVTIIEVAGKKVTDTVLIPVRGANRLKFTPDGKRVLISGLGGGATNNLVVLDSVTRKEVAKFDLGGGAAGIVIVPDGSRAYVAVSGKDKVAVLDLRTLEINSNISTGKQPDGLAWVQPK